MQNAPLKRPDGSLSDAIGQAQLLEDNTFSSHPLKLSSAFFHTHMYRVNYPIGVEPAYLSGGLDY